MELNGWHALIATIGLGAIGSALASLVPPRTYRAVGRWLMKPQALPPLVLMVAFIALAVIAVLS